MSKKRVREISPERGTKRAAPVVLAAEYDGRKVAILRRPDYQATITAIKRAFTSLYNSQIILSANFKEFNGELEITEETWPELLPHLKELKIKLNHRRQDIPCTCACGCIRVFVVTCDLKKTPLYISPNQKVGSLRSKIDDVLGLASSDYSLGLDGIRLNDSKTFAYYDIEPGHKIDLFKEQVGGKPVIYLLTPARILKVQAKLSLVKSWKFSAIYPPTSIQFNQSTNTSIGESVTWIVDANPDGTLFDHETGRGVTYLFWEAHTGPALPVSPPRSPLRTSTGLPPLAFDPALPVIEPNNSVLLPFDKVTGYIDDALLGLGLHTEARTSFITYWLPSLLRHSFVALRFLPQAEYEPAAPLNVTPAPEITTRVFMLFRGVAENIIDQWEAARARAGEDASMWRDVVGVDLQKATDPGLFRVLEWGGMEIK